MSDEVEPQQVMCGCTVIFFLFLLISLLFNGPPEAPPAPSPVPPATQMPSPGVESGIKPVDTPRLDLEDPQAAQPAEPAKTAQEDQGR
jgi:hypothetical protein